MISLSLNRYEGSRVKLIGITLANRSSRDWKAVLLANALGHYQKQTTDIFLDVLFYFI